MLFQHELGFESRLQNPAARNSFHPVGQPLPVAARPPPVLPRSSQSRAILVTDLTRNERKGHVNALQSLAKSASAWSVLLEFLPR